MNANQQYYALILFLVFAAFFALFVLFASSTAATQHPVCQCECATPTPVLVLPSTPMSAEDWFEKVTR